MIWKEIAIFELPANEEKRKSVIWFQKYENSILQQKRVRSLC
jgi:hypothetical protein